MSQYLTIVHQVSLTCHRAGCPGKPRSHGRPTPWWWGAGAHLGCLSAPGSHDVTDMSHVSPLTTDHAAPTSSRCPAKHDLLYRPLTHQPGDGLPHHPPTSVLKSPLVSMLRMCRLYNLNCSEFACYLLKSDNDDNHPFCSLDHTWVSPIWASLEQ